MKRWHKSFAVLFVCLLSFGSIGYLGLQHFGKAAYAQSPVTFTDFSLPNGFWPSSISNGPDGNLWFTENGPNNAYYIARITPNGTITEFPVDTTIEPTDITSGPDGNLWFTALVVSHGSTNYPNDGKIARMTTAGVITEFSVPTPGGNADSITTGPDGNLWFTESQTNKIGRISPHGIITEFSVPTVGSGTTNITKGPDGNLWFTEYGSNKIGQITPTGNITEFTLTANSYPDDIASGPDGNLWFTENSTSAPKIGRITPGGVITEFPLPAGSIAPYSITNGPDGNMWFTETGNGIGYITTTGSITELTPPNNSSSWDITKGPDGNLWFTGFFSPVIVRVSLTHKPQTYLALGDSFSSGEGNPPFSAGMDCHRSYDAWPYLLAKSDARLWLLGNYACTGAKASNALTKSYNPCSLPGQLPTCPQPPQISVMKSLKPDIVTITIGGNDIGFASTIRGCYLEGIAHRQNLCVDRLYSQVAVIKSFGKKAVGYYKEIKAALPGKSKLYIVGYPNLFPTNQKDAIHCGWLSNAGRAEFNTLAILLDKVLHDAANAAGVNYISTLYALKGHELCTSSSWVNPIGSKHGPPEVTSDAHPTLAGQQAMETMVDAGIFP